MDRILAKTYLGILKKYNLNAGQSMGRLGKILNINRYKDLHKFWESLGFTAISGCCCLNGVYVKNIENFKKVYGDFLRREKIF